MSAPAHAARSGSAAVAALQAGQHGLFAVLFVVSTALSAGGPLPRWAIALIALLAGWYGAGIILARVSGRKLVGAAWVAGLIALWAPLAVVAPPFRYLVLALFLLALHLLNGWAGWLAVVALTAGIITLELRANPADPVPHILGPSLGAVVAALFNFGYRAVLEESREKSQLVAELTATRDDLEALQDELARTQRESGALMERSRLARDIHDTLAQGFSSIVLLSRAGLSRGGADPELLEQIEQTAADNLVEARRVVHALAPAALDDAPLAAALQRLAERTHEQTGIQIDVAVEGERRPIPTPVEVGLLRFTQGALANIRQHAQAHRAQLSLSYSPDAVSVDVVDDGIGFDPEHIPPSPSGGGFGLRAMRERIAELGGTLEVESAPGDGTALAAHIPLEG